ncbi:DNA mismatch repair protein MutS [Proteiniclasticum sp. QWL-01]|uniref:DNA mismatch repair protein MutS n=1 Tax=Proteiniclasticum sp. QWL-01 TaxID=3036945 RepID=UPI00241119A1|nr:DNA mismatch repair protein MutS [Proteiniclasticum sp. QWL-01]WFF73548.1 DNA mismatch repair protein MutS [Proteiniclasticum sp. QWL-01]
MKKQTNVDIISELSKLVDRHVEHYREDFDIDKKIILEAAQSERMEDKPLIWFCRQNGTHCLRETETFIRDTREHNTLRYYAEQSGEDITARVVVPKAVSNGIVMGDVFEASFREMAANVARDAVAPLASELTFSDGFVQSIPFNQSLRQASLLESEHGEISAIHVVPEDKSALQDVLSQQKRQREKLPEADKQEKLSALPVSEFRKYEEIKKAHPAALVCFAQNGYFELYGEDAKKAAPLLGTKLLDKKLRGHAALPVTGFREEAWVAASQKLWKSGAEVFLSKDGETFKELHGADYIPVGAVLQVGNVQCRIDSVDYAVNEVTLTNTEVKNHPVRYTEDVAYVRSFVEDAGLAIFSAIPEKREETPKERTSIREKLKAPKRDAPTRPVRTGKVSGKEMEL